MNELLKYAPNTKLFEPMAAHCTMRVGGPARALVIPENPEELRNVLTHLHRISMPFKIVGKGANLLISDAGFDGAVIILGKGFTWLERRDDLVSAGAGLSLASLCAQLARMGIDGYDFAAQIPGTVGGAIVNNAGAYGQDWSHLIQDVTMLSFDGTERVYQRDELQLRYRHSWMKEKGGVVLVGATFLTRPGDPEVIQQRIREHAQKRAATQPVSEFSAGCIFKNPSKNSAGNLIETAGLKGESVGNAMVSLKHANFIVNRGRATAREVMDLIRKVKDSVYDRYEVQLETEVELVGSF